jgi:hypothetical protein
MLIPKAKRPNGTECKERGESKYGRRISLLPRLRTLSKVGQFGEWRVVLHGHHLGGEGKDNSVRLVSDGWRHFPGFSAM